jgi:hypothetical protein
MNRGKSVSYILVSFCYFLIFFHLFSPFIIHNRHAVEKSSFGAKEKVCCLIVCFFCPRIALVSPLHFCFSCKTSVTTASSSNQPGPGGSGNFLVVLLETAGFGMNPKLKR